MEFFFSKGIFEERSDEEMEGALKTIP